MQEIDSETMQHAIGIVREAGRCVLAHFTTDARPSDRDDIVACIKAMDQRSLAILRPGLERLRPMAGWVEDELEEGALPPGEWWVVDPLEGAINFVHGQTDWCVTATLARDNVPVLAVVHLPLAGDVYVAVEGQGAVLNGSALSVSSKMRLDGAMVGTGQASPLDDAVARDRLGWSAARMLHHALTTRMSVPATWQLLQVAAGRSDGFWQFSGVRSGLAAGALLVREAGGAVSDTKGAPWQLGKADFVGCAPGIHAEILDVLSATHS